MPLALKWGKIRELEIFQGLRLGSVRKEENISQFLSNAAQTQLLDTL